MYMLSFEEKYRLMQIKEKATDLENFCECVLDDIDHGTKDKFVEQMDYKQLDNLRVSAHKLAEKITEILNDKES
jgi:hypothetical protein